MGIDPSAMQGGGGPPGMAGPPGAGGPPGGAPGGAPDPMALLALAKLSRRKRHPGGGKSKHKGKRRK